MISFPDAFTAPQRQADQKSIDEGYVDLNIAVTLDDVVFTGFEVPETIPFGGDQALTVHDLPGGVRVIDAMGPVEADITWSGRFRSSTATLRARYIDYLRKRGTAVLLTWGDFRKTVVIRKFQANHETPWEIPYTITLAVQSDDTLPVLHPVPGFNESMDADLNDALGLGNGLGIATITRALAGVSTAWGLYKAVKSGSMKGLSIGQMGALAQTGLGISSTALGVADNMTADSALAGVHSSIVSARSAVSTAMIPLGAYVKATGSAGAAPGGGNPLAIGNMLLGTSSALGNAYQMKQIDSRLGRMQTNVASQQG